MAEAGGRGLGYLLCMPNTICSLSLSRDRGGLLERRGKVNCTDATSFPFLTLGAHEHQNKYEHMFPQQVPGTSTAAAAGLEFACHQGRFYAVVSLYHLAQRYRILSQSAPNLVVVLFTHQKATRNKNKITFVRTRCPRLSHAHPSRRTLSRAPAAAPSLRRRSAGRS